MGVITCNNNNYYSSLQNSYNNNVPLRAECTANNALEIDHL